MRNIAMCYYQQSVTTRLTDRQTDTRQSDPYVPLCFAGDTKTTHTSSSLSNIEQLSVNFD